MDRVVAAHTHTANQMAAIDILFEDSMEVK